MNTFSFIFNHEFNELHELSLTIKDVANSQFSDLKVLTPEGMSVA